MRLRTFAAGSTLVLLALACSDSLGPRATGDASRPAAVRAGESLQWSSDVPTLISSRLAPGKCMEVNGGTETAGPGLPLAIWDCHGGMNQRWALPAPGTTGEVRAYGMCLDDWGAQGNDGDHLVIWPCHGGHNQQWTVTGDGEIRGINGKCVDVWFALPENGAALKLYSCHGGSNQRWDVTAPPSNDAPAVLIAAGDIADCDRPRDEATAALVDGIQGLVVTLGDNVYDDGTAEEYANCYEPSWGRHKVRTRPAPGNHEYHTPGASGYFGYFGDAAGEPGKGYYSFDHGAWHVVVLNSGRCSEVSCSENSAQVQWLRADLNAHRTQCTLAIFHHPRFNSGSSHGDNVTVGPFWNALYEYGTDVILNGHEHVYERFGPQTPSAAFDPAWGIRQFTVGTGGASLRSFSATPKANSEARLSSYYGVLKLELRAASYRWAFISTDGATRDEGEASCH